MRMYGAIIKHLVAAPARAPPRVWHRPCSPPPLTSPLTLSCAQPGEERARVAPSSLLDHLGLLHQPLGTLLQLGEVRVLVACGAGAHRELGT